MNVDPAMQARILRALEAATAKLEAAERARTEPIAIVGIGCRFPGGADDPRSFWRLLAEGIDAVGDVPADRPYLDPGATAGAADPGHAGARRGAFLREVDRFDADLFGMSGREAASLDPQQRILLETAWEALERAGLTRAALHGTRAGVFVGITSCDYGRLISRAKGQVDAYYVTGNTLNAAAGRLAYLLGLRGPALAVDTACSSSLVAVHLAVQALRAGECDAALAGGVNLVLAPEGTVALAKAGALSPDGRCKPFDAAAAGIGRAEGCGVVVLKRQSDARRDGDEVWALIRGSAVNQDGASSGLTVPNGLAQEDVIRRALANARVEACDVDYVEAHGTGTPLGDPIEIAALGEVFGPGRPVDRPLVVGALKGNFGHAESAAGIAGIVKVALAMRQGAIPPQLHFREPSAHVDWDRLPLVVPTGMRPWPEAAKGRFAGVSGFGLSGTNAHVVLEGARADETAPRLSATRAAPRLLVLSAASEAGLRDAARRHAAWLRETTSELPDLCFSAATTRDHQAVRLAVVATSKEDAAAKLEDRRRHPARAADGRAAPSSPGIAFVFSGQGSQYAGMGRGLYEREEAYRAAIDRCAEVLGLRGVALLEGLNGEGGSLEGTELAQPALFAVEYGLAELWRSWGVAPAAVAGHSVGEFAAACAAGVFGLEEGLSLVAERGRLMGMLPKGAGMMVAALGDDGAVAAVAREDAARLSIAALNGPGHTVLSGERGAVSEAMARLSARGIACRPLAVSHAFHSPLMAPMVEAFAAAASRVAMRAPALPFVSGLTGEVAGAEVATPGYWARHVLEPVRFADAMASLRRLGVRAFLEVGPGATLAGLGARILDDPSCVWATSLERRDEPDRSMLTGLASLWTHGAPIDWRAVYKGRDMRRVALPTTAFQRKRYWFDDSAPSAGRPEIGVHVFDVAWTARPAVIEPRRPGPWLVLADEGAIGRNLAERLRRRGETVDVLRHREAADLAARLKAQARRPEPPRVVHLWGLDAEGDAGPDAGAWSDVLDRVCVSALDLVKAAAAVPGRPPRLFFVTRGAQAVGSGPVAVSGAPLLGLGRVVAREHPEMFARLIDLDPAGGDDACLLRELDAMTGEPEVAYRDGQRLVPRLRPHASPLPASADFAPDAAYVVTGGLGGLGLAVAEWMVGQGARRVVLAGRRAPSPDAAGRIEAMRRAGAHIRAVQADMAVAADVERLLVEAGRLGPLRGIVHAAGTLDDGALLRQDASRFASVMAGKALGALRLDRLTRGRGLDFLVFFSSIASVGGPPGQGNYAAANALLDALAAERRRHGESALSISFGPWADDGMAARLGEAGRLAMRARGIEPLAAADALNLLGRLIRGPSAHLVVAGLDPSARARLANDPILDALAPRLAEAPSQAAAWPLDDRAAALAYLRGRVAEVLRVGEHGALADDLPLRDAGLDSIMATELHNRVARDHGVGLPLGRLLAGATLNDAAELLFQAVTLERLAGDHVGEPAKASEVEELVL